MNGNSSVFNRSDRDNLDQRMGLSFILGIIRVVLFSLTILLAFVYTALIIARPAFRQNKLNWFTVNICLQSALFCILVLLTIGGEALKIYRRMSCRVQGYLYEMLISQVLYSHCVAALCRFLAIVYAAKHLFRSSGFALVCIAFGWLIAPLLACPYLFLDGFQCPSRRHARFLLYYTLLAMVVLPMAIVALCNCRLLCFVRRSSRQVHAEPVRNRALHARDIQLMKVLIGTFAVVVIGWIPLFILQALIGNVSVPRALDVCLRMLPSLSMFFDVCLLIFTNQPVRLYLKEQILRKPRISLVKTICDNALNTNQH